MTSGLVEESVEFRNQANLQQLINFSWIQPGLGVSQSSLSLIILRRSDWHLAIFDNMGIQAVDWIH